MNWAKQLKQAGYDVVAPDGSIWERAHGEWTSRSFPGAKYDTDDLAERYEGYDE